MAYLVVACHCAVMLVFGVSALGKLRGRQAFDEFARSARTMLSAVVPGWSVRRAGLRRVARVVVVTEVAVPVLVVVPSLNRLGHAVSMMLLAVFSYGIVATVRAGIRTSCRCFGTRSAPIGPPHLVRNALLFGTATIGLVFGPVRLVHLAPGGLALAVAAAAVLAILVVRFDDVVGLFSPASSTLPDGPTR
jgi:hypothetical protein